MTRGSGPVVVVSQLPPPVHGSTVMTAHLLDQLTILGHAPILVDRRFSSDVGQVGRPTLGKVLAVPALIQRLRGALRSSPTAVVYFLTNRPGSFLVDSLLLAMLRLSRQRVVLYVHTTGFRALADRGGAWRWLVTRALRTGQVVTLGPTLQDDVLPFTRTAPAVIANMSAPPESPLPEPATAGTRVLFLSNLLPEKGVDAFIRVAAVLRDSGADCSFTIAGSGSSDREAAVTAAIRAGGLEDRVHFVGRADHDEKWRLLREADVLLFPSQYRYEAQPLTIVEALSQGVPVVAYDVGGVRDLVQDGSTGRLIPAGDERALAAAVRTIASDPDLAARMAAAGRSRFAERHAPDAYREAWRRMLDVHRPSTPPEDLATPPEDFASSAAVLGRLVRRDWAANPRDAKSRAVLVAFRLAQWAIRDPDAPRLPGLVAVAAYRFWTEFGIGLELRPKTRVGGGLTIFHGYALVVNDHARIGRGVTLRNSVTIGNRVAGGACPVIGDRVQIGAGAFILGGITVGDDARIGAGAVVLHDVPAGASVAGNPARILASRA